MKIILLTPVLFVSLLASCQMRNDTIVSNLSIGGGQKSILAKFDNHLIIEINDPIKQILKIVEIDDNGNVLHSINLANDSYLMTLAKKENTFYTLLCDSEKSGSTIKKFGFDPVEISVLIRDEKVNIRSFDVGDSTIRYVCRKEKSGEIVIKKNNEEEKIPFPYKYTDYSQFKANEILSYSNGGENATFFVYDMNTMSGSEITTDGTIKELNVYKNDSYLLIDRKNTISVNYIDNQLNIVEIFNFNLPSGNVLLGKSLHVFDDEIVVVFSEQKSKAVFVNNILHYSKIDKKSTLIENCYSMKQNTYLFEKIDNHILLWIYDGRLLIKSEL